MRPIGFEPRRWPVLFCSGDSVMRWLFGLCLLLCLGACSLFEPSGQRYAIYFQESSAQTVNSAEGVVVDAAN
jgi:hypothetical protein